MLDTLVKSFENAFVEFSGRRMLFVVFVLALVVGGAFTVDYAIEYSFQRRINGRIAALERLHALETAGIRSSPSLAPIFDSLVTRLRTERSALATPTDPRVEARDKWIRAIAASWIPLFFSLWGIVQVLRRQPGGASLFGGALVVSVLLAIPAALMPTIHSMSTTIAILFVCQFLFVVFLTSVFGSKAGASAD